MKYLVLVAASFMAFFTAKSQTASSVIFSEGGEKFTVYLNGEQKNDSPSSNVKIKDLSSEFYICKVVFEDRNLGEVVMKNFALEYGMEYTYVVKMTKKGQYALRFYNTAPASDSRTVDATPRESQVIIVEEVKEAPAVEVIQETRPVPSAKTTVVTQTTTTTRPIEEETVKVTMDVPGINMNINMNVTEPNVKTEMVETTVTTTTTTNSRPTPAAQPAVQTRPQPVKEEPIIISKNGCTSSMPSGDFGKIKSSIESKSFSESKMTVAKQAIKGKCPTSAQIKDFCGLFNFEEDKLEFAKHSYDFVWDPQNYYEVYDAFTFESSIEELSKHIDKK